MFQLSSAGVSNDDSASISRFNLSSTMAYIILAPNIQNGNLINTFDKPNNVLVLTPRQRRFHQREAGENDDARC